MKSMFILRQISILSSHLHLDPQVVFSFMITNLYEFLIFHVRALCFAHLDNLDLITVNIFGDKF
jgi:hypothetical protein